MIIKIKNKRNGWLIFDEVDEFEYTEHHQEDKTKECYNKPPLANPNNVEVCDFRGGVNSYVVLYFSQKTRYIKFSTDRIVYVMNNDGKTIEKLN